MKTSFTLGAVSGISALALGFPLAAQFAGAQSSAGSPTALRTRPAFHSRAPLSQDDVRELIDRDNAFLLNVDAFVAIQKEAIQNHRIALEAAADIADETERNEAVIAAHDALRAEVSAAIEANPDLTDVLTRFGPHRGRGHMNMKMGGMPGGKLGMTAEELRAARESGKTIREIAEEKGVEPPMRPTFKARWGEDGEERD